MALNLFKLELYFGEVENCILLSLKKHSVELRSRIVGPAVPPHEPPKSQTVWVNSSAGSEILPSLAGRWQAANPVRRLGLGSKYTGTSPGAVCAVSVYLKET